VVLDQPGVVTAAAGVVADQPAAQVVVAAAAGVVLAVVQSPQVEAVEELQLELVLVHTGQETVHGQSVIVKVVAEVTVYVLPPWVSRVAYGQ
jgi:hypothetical protein